jgi:hypothetical protein
MGEGNKERDVLMNEKPNQRVREKKKNWDTLFKHTTLHIPLKVGKGFEGTSHLQYSKQ